MWFQALLYPSYPFSYFTLNFATSPIYIIPLNLTTILSSHFSLLFIHCLPGKMIRPPVLRLSKEAYKNLDQRVKSRESHMTYQLFFKTPNLWVGGLSIGVLYHMYSEQVKIPLYYTYIHTQEQPSHPPACLKITGITNTQILPYTRQQDMKEEIKRLEADRRRHNSLFDLSTRTMSFKSQTHESQMMRMIRDMDQERKQR